MVNGTPTGRDNAPILAPRRGRRAAPAAGGARPAAGTGRRPAAADGFAMVALLVGLAVMGTMMAMVLPVWHHAARREREAELIFRGEQYARAVALWQRQRPGSFPPDLETLVEERFLRKRYLDPITGGDFQLILQADVAPEQGPAGAGAGGPSQVPGGESQTRAGGRRTSRSPRSRASGGVEGGIAGVVSRSPETSIAVYNGETTYNAWRFVYTPDSDAAAAAQAQPEGQPPAGGGLPGAGGPGGMFGAGTRR